MSETFNERNEMKRRHEVLFEQLKTYRNELLTEVEEVTEEEADLIPEGFNNNIRWNLGHVLLDQYLWIQALTKEELPLPAAFNDWFGFGTNPSRFTVETPKLPELLGLLRRQPDDILERNRIVWNRNFRRPTWACIPSNKCWSERYFMKACIWGPFRPSSGGFTPK